MSLESTLQSVLLTVAPGKAFQDIAPQGSTAPFIVWSLISKNTNNSLQGASNRQNSHIQVDAYAATPTARKTLADAILVTMQSSGLSYIEMQAQNLYEKETKLFRSLTTFSVWSLG